MVLVGKKEGRQAPIMECPSRPLVLPVLLGCQRWCLGTMESPENTDHGSETGRVGLILRHLFVHALSSIPPPPLGCFQL